MIKGQQAEFIRIPNATGRFYYFKFTDRSIKKCFFWLQDASTEQDSKIEQIIKDALNTVPAFVTFILIFTTNRN